MAQETFVFGDIQPNAPELAARGAYAVGVRTLTLVNPDQIDILSGPSARYDRTLMIEVWYPAFVPPDAVELTTYADTLGRADQPGSLVPFTFNGRALRDAAPDDSGAPYPLVVISHGYPGSRFMLTYLTENLASKGYVVAAIDHTESTFGDVGAFASTLLNRPLDQGFVIDEFARLNDEAGWLNGLVDADNSALIGYSMGGYGVLNSIGAGVNNVVRSFVGEAIAPRMANTEGYAPHPRVRAAVLFAPWGGDLTVVGAAGVSLWDNVALAGIRIPTLWIAGSHDDVSMYDGIRRLFINAVNSDRRLLTYINALHNVAPNPPVPEARTLSQYQRYAEPVWDEATINNINQHFITAFLDLHLKNDAAMLPYLNPTVQNASDGVYAIDSTGEFTDRHTYWAGFQPRTAFGMTFEVLSLP